MNIPQTLIPRNHYTEKIRPYVRKNIAKVLTGQRRVGKSFLLFQLMQMIREEDAAANIIYINLEDFAFSHITSAEGLHAHIAARLREGEYNYIFIDEVQDVPGFERVVRSLLLSPLNDVYLTGSNAHMLSGELATYLSGRYIECTVHSLCYAEFLEFHHLADEDRSLDLYMRYGGLPYLTNLALRDEVVDEYLKSVYSTIVFRDVVGRYNLRNTAFLENLIRFLSENIGNLFSAKNISDYLKSQHATVSVNQIQTYTGYLCNAFLLHRVERYDLVGKRIFEIGEKYYFENLGLRNVVVGYRVSDRGKLMENMVYNHLLYRGYTAKVGFLGGQEIDFIAERNNEKVYVQVALRIDDETTAQREFGNLLRIRDNYPKIVVTEDSLSGRTWEGVRHYPLREFLMTFG